MKQRPGPGSLVDQSPPVKLGPYPTRDMSVNNRDSSTTPYTTQPQYQQQQQQQQQLQMRSSSSLSQTNPMYSYNHHQQQQQECVPPQQSQTSSSRGHLTSSMSMDDLTAATAASNSRHNGVASFSPCPSPMPTSYMHRSDSTSHLSSMSGVTHQQPQSQPNHDQCGSKRPPRYQYSATPLKFTRQVFKNTSCYTVISNVECQIEVLKESKSKNKMTIREILRIKFDEDLIKVFKCKSPLPFSVDEMPSCPDKVPCFSLDLLPTEYWSKYTNACRYMMLIRNKTPKVTVYYDQAKAVLFDAPGFFEARFANCKINFGNGFVHIVKASGTQSITFLAFISSSYIKIQNKIFFYISTV